MERVQMLSGEALEVVSGTTIISEMIIDPHTRHEVTSKNGCLCVVEFMPKGYAVL